MSDLRDNASRGKTHDTQWKRVDRTRWGCEQRGCCLLEVIPLGAVECDAHGVITHVNPACMQIAGYSCDELVGKSPAAFIEARSQKEAFPAYIKHLVDEQPAPSPYQCQGLTKDGRRIGLQVNWAYRRNSQGQVTGFSCILTELTDASERLSQEMAERWRAEKALWLSERRFRNYFEQGLIGMAAISVEKQWLQVNDRLCQMLEYSREELLAKTWEELTYPDDLDKTRTHFQQLLAGEIDHYVTNKRYLRKDQSILYAMIHVRAFRRENGSVDHVVALVEDITTHTLAEQALQQSHSELRAIYDGMVDGLLLVDRETHQILRVNTSLCHMLSYPEDVLLGMSVKDIHPADTLESTLEKFRLHIKTSGMRHAAIPVLRRDGTVFLADIYSTHILYNGRPCMMSVFRDVTERQRAQEALQRERRTLKHLLRAGDHERQLIAYDIHDGLAQQLAGSIMQFEAYGSLKKDKPQQAADAFQAGIALLRQSHGEARRLISGVRPLVLDESGVVAAITHLVNDQPSGAGPKIEFSSKVRFDRLAPVLENVIFRIAQEGLTNACKHSQSDTVRIVLLQRGDRIHVEVHDQGIGFDSKSGQEGRYGLQGIRERARALGGRSRVRSRPGKGTSILVELPLIEADKD